MYTLSNPIPGTPYFGTFETLTAEQSQQALLDAWATPTQQLYNLMHKTCPSCNGQGYASRRIKVGDRGFRIERDNIGCYECKGTGAVLK